jgi:four helix bundle protein
VSGSITRFEDLDAWLFSLELADAVCDETEQGRLMRRYGIRDQMERAAVSVLSNIAEGFDRGNNRELIYFLRVAKGSVAELRAQTYLVSRRKYITDESSHRLLALTGTTSRVLGGLIRYLKGLEAQGVAGKHGTQPQDRRQVREEEAEYLVAMVQEAERKPRIGVRPRNPQRAKMSRTRIRRPDSGRDANLGK